MRNKSSAFESSELKLIVHRQSRSHPKSKLPLNRGKHSESRDSVIQDQLLRDVEQRLKLFEVGVLSNYHCNFLQDVSLLSSLLT